MRVQMQNAEREKIINSKTDLHIPSFRNMKLSPSISPCAGYAFFSNKALI